MKILLLSDSTMCADAGGLSQTLYNIFSFSSTENILCITSESAFKGLPSTSHFYNRYLTYRFEIIPVPRNRLARFIMPVADWFNYHYNHYFGNFSRLKKRILDFKPDAVVSCSNGPVGLFMHHKLLDGLNIKKVFPFFMDDWMNQSRWKFLDKWIFNWMKKILSQNPSWLMISEDLANIFSERYGVRPKRLLEIHNPVDLFNAPDAEPVHKKAEYTLAYAGSLWQMHFDSFYAVAKAMHYLNSKKKVNLVVYTSADFWNWRKTDLEPLGVIYGGNIPYKDIHQKLAQADALILSSSFTQEWITHSKGSLQTKVTDYLKSQRLIISCGPSYSANHNFLKKHACGVCIETEDSDAVSTHLENILDNIEDYQYMVNNGWEVLQKDFTFIKVHKKLTDFLSEPVNFTSTSKVSA